MRVPFRNPGAAAPLLLAAALAANTQSAAQQSPAPDISIEAFYRLPSLIGTEPRGASWSPDSRRVAFLWNDDGTNFRDVYVIDASAAAGRGGALPPPTRITQMPRPALIPDPGPDDERQRAAIAAELDGGIGSVQWLPSTDGRRMMFAFRGTLYTVALGEEPRRMTSEPGAIQRPTFSPQGDRLAFLRGGDLWVAPLLGDTLGAPTRITQLARAGIGVENFAWAPDGNAFAIIETDRSRIAVRQIPDYLPDEVRIVEMRRAYPGEPSEERRLGLVRVARDPMGATRAADARADGGAEGVDDVRWVDLAAEPFDLIFTFAWSPNGEWLVVDKSDVFVKDRRILLVSARTLATRELVREREPDNVSAEWRTAWAADGAGVYFTSDRAYDYHVWYVSVGGGQPRQITRGEWAVSALTVTPRALYVIGNPERREERHLLRVPLRGGEATRVSVRPGTHAPSISPDGRMAAVVFSSDTVPPDLYVTDLTAARPSLATERRVTHSPQPAFAAYTWVTPSYVTFPSRADGATLHGRLQLPSNYEPGRRYPVIIGSVYSNTARNQWGGRNAHPLWGLDRVLLERGYVILALDVAGSSGHGTAFRRRILRDYGGIDVEDIHSGVEWLIAEGLADPERVGIWGSSYGGLLTTMSQFTKPGVYKAGIAGAPATNVWHALTGEQRVMGRPQDNPREYANASAHTKAAGLQDALMIIHGMRDPVVLFRDSVWLTQHLLQMGKNVELYTLPDAGHGWDTAALYQTRAAFNAMLRFFDNFLNAGVMQ